MRKLPLVPLSVMPLLALAACEKSSPAPTASGTNLAITVKPLSLPGVSDVSYGITVTTQTGETVWAQAGLTSQQYGDGKGALTYIGTCDASPEANPHQIALVLESITDRNGRVLTPGDDYQNPAPASAPVILEADCVENADVPVTFNLTILRSADQGFFDVAVTFSDIFCSAKVDCVDSRTGEDIKLLHRPGGDRDTTVVMALACTSGEDDLTWLHMSDVAVECGQAPNQVTYWLNPAAGLGNTGPVPPIFFQTAVYQGAEQLVPYDKCYWNMAFGVNEGPAAADCRLVVSGTASAESWVGNDGHTPADTVYPYISFDVTLTGPDGQVMCGQNPLNGQNSGVQTRYTQISGGRFSREMQCGGTPTQATGLQCQGTIGGDGVAFIDSPLGLSVAFGAAISGPALPDCAYAPHDPSCRSTLYQLPADTHVGSCCVNACCGQL